MKLYEITGAYRQIESLMDDPEIPADQMLEAIDKVDGELKSKATNIAMLVGNLEATAQAIKEAESRMAERRKAIENRVESIRSYVLRNMQAAGIQVIECDLFRISLRNNPPSCVIDDESKIPIEYLRQPKIPDPAPDKKKMLEDMKAGVIIDGAHMEQKQSLIIK
ncbi:MAG: siphovirus Gp157 family protein [Patescibacteria group bacterium]|nr:siphovirus Gp157 family protein [Patescibacteria group bacterium]